MQKMVKNCPAEKFRFFDVAKNPAVHSGGGLVVLAVGVSDM